MHAHALFLPHLAPPDGKYGLRLVLFRCVREEHLGDSQVPDFVRGRDCLLEDFLEDPI